MSRGALQPNQLRRVWRICGWTRLRRFTADRHGVAALELALLAPTLLLLLMGIFDFGKMTYTVMKLHAAAQAGAQYVYANPTSCTTTAVASAVTNATTLTLQTPTVNCTAYYCVTSNALVASTSGATCGSGEKSGTYATITVATNFSPIAPWSGLVFPHTLSASAKIRYQ
jgi:Flp pilus assembly protein TadG